MLYSIAVFEFASYMETACFATQLPFLLRYRLSNGPNSVVASFDPFRNLWSILCKIQYR
jgi:hypothetical protein